MATISVRRKQEGGRDYDITEKTVEDENGYKFHLEGDEMRTFYDNNGSRTFAANATVKLGAIRNGVAPSVFADVDDGRGEV